MVRIEGQGTALEQADYTFEDTEVQANIAYYYRLKQVDLPDGQTGTDGQFEYSDIVLARIKDNVAGMNVYPNPIGEGQQLIVQFFANEQVSDLLIVDKTGKIVSTISVNSIVNGWNDLKVDVSNLSSGVYFITDRQGNYKRFVLTK